MIEELKTVGAIVGLLTGIFTVFDRYIRGRPIASLSIVSENSKRYAKLRIANVGRHDVAILDVSVSPRVFNLSEDMEAESILRASMGERPFFMLRPEGQQELYLLTIMENNIPLELKPQRIAFRVSWRRGNATWLPQLPVFVRTTTDTVRHFVLDKPDIKI